MRVTAFLASRGARTHRRAWAAVFAALAFISLLLGTLGLALGSAGLGYPRVARYAAAALVVAGDQNTRFTATPWGSKPRTAEAGLTERVRVPAAALGVVRKVPGVRAAVADEVFPVGRDGRAAAGRPWEAAQLAHCAVRDGRAPRRAHEVVVGGGARIGARTVLRVGGTDRAYTVVGAAAGPRTAVYFTAGEARRLAGHPGSVDAIGVIARPGVETEELHARVRAALDAAGAGSVGPRADGDKAGLRVLTGNGRGGAEFLDVGPARAGLLELLGSVAATVVLTALLVVSSTVVQALRQRAREWGLLRAVGATPGQVRGAVGKEVGRVAVRAALVGAVGAFPGYLALRGVLAARGALPAGLELPCPPWLWTAPLVTAGVTVLVARLAALIAGAGAARLRPAEALRETAPGTARKVTGLVLLLVGVSSAGTATLQGGEAAGAAAGAAAVTMVSACALLGPWIADGAMRVLGVPLRRYCGPAGYLAAANCRAAARRSGAALTPVVLVTAFIGVQLSAGATLTHAGAAQARESMRAGLAVRADGGLPAGAVERIRGVPGVRAATDVVHGTVVLARRDAGEPRLDRLPVLGVTPQRLTHTLDPGVREGTVRGLRPGTVAVGADRARSLDLRPGSAVTLRFGNGAPARLRVVATYERSLALGDFLFSRDELLRHRSRPDGARVLVTVAPGGDRAAVAAALAAAVPGVRVETAPAPVRVAAEHQALTGVVTVAAVAAIGGFTVIAVLSTLSLIALGRRPELRLLRLAGAGRGALRRMLRLEAAAMAATGLAVGAAVASVPLLAFSLAVARTVPYLPAVAAVLIIAVVAGTTGAGTMLPLRAVLRGPYPGKGAAEG
ncbi:ABC transporter permease [Streptomyces lydicus]|uniref:ABC transporter permease n=1 Tax=Streptomyces lydicus TaxID=47763 RepID=A0A3S9YE45_9ACTN|nr:ABC transporter permease [Streptomyces lydicus]AZS73180.1 ABC transporter permease [Streptomyces lydicus]